MQEEIAIIKNGDTIEGNPIINKLSRDYARYKRSIANEKSRFNRLQRTGLDFAAMYGIPNEFTELWETAE